MNTCKRQRTNPTMSEEQWRSERNTMLRQIIPWFNTEQYQAVAELLHPLAFRPDISEDMYNEMIDIIDKYLSIDHPSLEWFLAYENLNNMMLKIHLSFL